MNQFNIHNITIDSSVYQHPADKKATQLILSNDAFQKALQYVSKQSLERVIGFQYRSNYPQLTPKNAPKIFLMIDEAREMFGVEARPEVFLDRRYEVHTTMLGIETPRICLSTQTFKYMDDQMLWGLIASEIAGIRNGFCQIRFIEWLCQTTGLLPDIVSDALFQNWHKYLQYSYDRSVLVAVGDFDVAMREVLAGEMPKDVLERMKFDDPGCGYMRQAQEFISNSGGMADLVRNYQIYLGKNAFYAARYLELYKFYHEQYFDLIEDFMEG